MLYIIQFKENKQMQKYHCYYIKSIFMLFEVLLETHMHTREFNQIKSKVDKSHSTTNIIYICKKCVNAIRLFYLNKIIL